MYFISTSARLAVPIRGQITEHHPVSGAVINVKRGLLAQFTPVGIVPDYAKEAVSKLAFFGRGTGLDEDPYERCGQLDTDAAAIDQSWTDEEKAEIEAFLAAHAGYDYVRADAPPLEAPWPNYDSITGDTEDVAKQVVATLESIGVAARYVADYERQNQARPGLLEVLDILASAEAGEVVAA